jgi:hypothetical protein
MTTSRQRLPGNHHSIRAGGSRLYRIVRRARYGKLYGSHTTVFAFRRCIASEIRVLARHARSSCDLSAAKLGECPRFSAANPRKSPNEGKTVNLRTGAENNQFSMHSINRERSAFPEFAADIAILAS